jgi:DNA-binding IclR family transcriptional regulator
MADYTYDELKHKTVAELRDIAKDLHEDAVQGYSQLNKEHLLPALCKALGIETHAHHHVVGGLDKNAVKAKLREIKAERDAALAAHDADKLKAIRRQYHRYNHLVRAHVR